MLFARDASIVNKINKHSEIMQLMGNLSLFVFLPLKVRLTLIRSAFQDRTTKSSSTKVFVYHLDSANSSHLSDLLLVVSLVKVFDKTMIRVYLETSPRQRGAIMKVLNQQASYQIGQEIMKGFCNFKTYVK